MRKRFALITAFLFVLLLGIPVTVLARHNENGVLFGHYGQPHNDEASGDIRFTVEVTGSADRVVFSVAKKAEPAKYLDTKTVTTFTSYGGYTYYKLTWNSTGYDNGDYRLYSYVECDDCAEGGYSDQVHHWGDNREYLEFKIINPEVPPPPAAEPPEDTCTGKLDEANTKAAALYEKHKANLLFIDSFYQQSTLFYERQNLDLQSYQNLLAGIGEKRKAASDDLVALEEYQTFSCEASLKDQALNFLGESSDARNNLEAYKDSVINLILAMLEEL